jgi:hypothetical protein
VEEVEGVHRGYPGKGGDMTEYLIAFKGEWVPDHTVEELSFPPDRGGIGYKE